MAAMGRGKLVEYLPDRLRPSFGDDGWESVFRPNSLILLCMLSTAFMAHFNAPKVCLRNNTLSFLVIGRTTKSFVYNLGNPL